MPPSKPTKQRVPRVVTNIVKQLNAFYADPDTITVRVNYEENVVPNRNATGPNKTQRAKKVDFEVILKELPNDTEADITREYKRIRKLVAQIWNTEIRRMTPASEFQWKRMHLEARTSSGAYRKVLFSVNIDD